MKKSCKKCVALEGLKCRLGYPIHLIPNPDYCNTIKFVPAPQVECPKPLIYDDYHHGKRYKKS